MKLAWVLGNKMYELLYHPRTLRQARKLPEKERTKIILEIKKLAQDPFSSGLNIKKLVNTQHSYRLRIGNLRVIYEVDQDSKKIYTHPQ